MMIKSAQTYHKNIQQFSPIQKNCNTWHQNLQLHLLLLDGIETAVACFCSCSRNCMQSLIYGKDDISKLERESFDWITPRKHIHTRIGYQNHWYWHNNEQRWEHIVSHIPYACTTLCFAPSTCIPYPTSSPNKLTHKFQISLPQNL